MDIEVRRLDERRLKQFIRLPFLLYKDDKKWVPPLISEMKGMLSSAKNNFLKSEHAYFMAYRNGKPAARVLAGINEKESEQQGVKRGFFSLFEAADKQSGRAVMQAAQGYLRDIGAVYMKGPFSPANGEEHRCVLVEGFDAPPVLYAAYNPPWYKEVFESFGMSKQSDMLGFLITPQSLPLEKFRRAVGYAKKRYGFEAYPIDFSNLEKELKDIHEILKGSDARDWGSGLPTWESVQHAAQEMKTLADPELVYIVRRNDGKPLAFVVSIPNYNEALIHMNGRLFPFGIIKLLYWKKRIKGMRIIMQFCVKEYEGKAAVSAAYLAIMQTGLSKGYEWGDASAIAEDNEKSWRPVVTAGGKLYRRFRYYEKQI